MGAICFESQDFVNELTEQRQAGVLGLTQLTVWCEVFFGKIDN